MRTQQTQQTQQPDASGDDALLRVKDLDVEFDTSKGIATAVSGMNFTVQRGEALGILGESGSGKSVLRPAR